MPYTYHDLVTPDELSDIKKYLFPEVSSSFDDTIFPSLEKPVIKKLILISERLEFVQNLKTLEDDISNKHSNKTSTKIQNGIKICTETFSCTYLGNDFSGVQFDIDAIRIYLLITCLDTIAGQSEYIDPFVFILSDMQNDNSNSLTQEKLESLGSLYKESFSLSKNFKKQFINNLHDNLKNKWIENFCVSATVGSCDGKNHIGEFNKESYASWYDKNTNEKISSIASALYDMRSQFTHTSLRNISPNLDIRSALKNHSKHLIRLNNIHLDTMLIATLRCLADRFVARNTNSIENSHPTTIFSESDTSNEWWFRNLI